MAAIEYVDGLSVPSAVPLILEGCPHIIVLKTFSKIHGMAGIRVGYGLAAAEIIGDLMQSPGVFHTSTEAIAGAVASLGDWDFLSCSYQMVKEGRDYRHLPQIRPYRRVGSCAIFLSMSHFSSSVT